MIAVHQARPDGLRPPVTAVRRLVPGLRLLCWEAACGRRRYRLAAASAAALGLLAVGLPSVWPALGAVGLLCVPIALLCLSGTAGRLPVTAGHRSAGRDRGARGRSPAGRGPRATG
ncbi:hypothetical protein ACWEQL_01650 [Kitasatospora sp. NPDC004240]